MRPTSWRFSLSLKEAADGEELGEGVEEKIYA